WTWRKARLYGTFGPTLLTAGHAFWMGHGEGDLWARFPELVRLGELERERALLAAARAQVLQHPGQFVLECLRNLWSFVWLRPGAGALYSRSLLLGYLTVYLPLLAGAGLGFRVIRQRREPYLAGHQAALL